MMFVVQMLTLGKVESQKRLKIYVNEIQIKGLALDFCQGGQDQSNAFEILFRSIRL